MRYWAWLAGRLVAGALLFWWAFSYLSPGFGDKEFQKALQASEHVQSLRMSMVSDPTPAHHRDYQVEMNCSKDVLHFASHTVIQDFNPPQDFSEEYATSDVAAYQRQADGSWGKPRGIPMSYAKGVCQSLSEGIATFVLPDFATMVKRGVIQKGDKKTVDGVKCREWNVTLRSPYPNQFDHSTICLGVDDHLPREMTVNATEHWKFSDFNAPIDIDIPGVDLQQVSSN
jgi:hypothetical protein